MSRLKVAVLTILSPLLAVLVIPILLVQLYEQWHYPATRNGILRQLQHMVALVLTGLALDAVLVFCTFFAPEFFIPLFIFWVIAVATSKGEI